nr:hypothetical protein [Bradyrhizobium sp. NBAIM03]
MPIKDVFLPLVGQPRGPALVAIEKCVSVAADLGARITALALEEDVFERPKVMLPDDREFAQASLEASDMQQLLNALPMRLAAPTSAPRAGRARCLRIRSERSWPSTPASATSRWFP